MAFSTRADDDQDEYGPAPMSEINVTPLVDVMLVLLIVFMIAAPLLAVGVPIDLPKSAAKPLVDAKPPIVVSLDADGKIFVEKTEEAKPALVATLRQDAAGDLTRRIHVRADKSLTYGAVMEVMGLINAAGFAKVALVSEAPGPAAD